MIQKRTILPIKTRPALLPTLNSLLILCLDVKLTFNEIYDVELFLLDLKKKKFKNNIYSI